ncbi:hypothetical protein DERP_003763 [Dermatophagoides pteronyssinus]|uniref:Uncharacterized protein n=1 Tax=Dermatophagoides pteronyssinus TaxID=6956 RepID=A0ABQ8JLK0_DERPT|nr:hypothetical protein DERP_003763 [Dermatophagoides pteronyssinus]
MFNIIGLSSTILIHVPISNVKLAALENIPNGIFGLLTCTVQNCDGPPIGYDVKLFLDKVNVDKFERLDKRPSGNCDNELFSTLNSVNFTQLLNDLGTDIRRFYNKITYLKPSLERLIKLPILFVRIRLKRNNNVVKDTIRSKLLQPSSLHFCIFLSTSKPLCIDDSGELGLNAEAIVVVVAAVVLAIDSVVVVVVDVGSVNEAAAVIERN